MAWAGATGLMAATLVLLQIPPAGIDKLWESAPLVAALLGGLYLIFKAYQSLVDKVIQALDANTKAFSDNAAATKQLADGVSGIHRRVDTLDQRIGRLEHPDQKASP